MNRTLKLFGRFFVFALVITMFSLALVTFSSTPAYAESTPVATSTISAPRTLKLTIPRMGGDDVYNLQTFLNSKGYNTGTPDGVFGPKTEAGVKLFQTANTLTPDGKAGKITLGLMNISSLGGVTSPSQSAGCTLGALFNTTTGKPCEATPKLTTLPAGCSSTSLFSTTSGVSCTTGLPAVAPVFKLPVVSGGGSSGPSIHTVSPTISGVTIPAQAQTPVSTLPSTTQYTATISWTGSPSVFLASTSYTATITLTAKSGYTLSGVTANYFTVAGATSTNLANSGVITAVFPATPLIQLTISNPTLTTSKAYDGSTSAVVSAGTLAGKNSGDTVTVSAVATYDTKNIGASKTITVVYTLGGSDAGNYIKPADYTVTTGTITQIPLTISNPTLTTSKQYDRSTNAVVTAGSLIGKVSGDDVTVSAVATYDIFNIGTNKTITVVYTLAGADAGNYTKPADRIVSSGVITQKQLTIVAPTLTLSKLYDRNTNAVVTANALIGVAGSEDVTVTGVATYDTANVGTGKTITVVYTISGAEIANYLKPVNYTTSSGVITAVQLTISAPTLTTTKVYNASTSAVVTAGTLAGILSPDTVTVSAVANYDTALVGTGKTITTVYTLGGAQAGNYTKPVNDINNTGVITSIVINTAGIAGVTAPVAGATPVATLADGTGYTAVIAWSPVIANFAPATVYTATVTLTPKTGYTLTGVTTNFFTVSGATATNSADSGVVTAVFPITGSTIATAAIAGVTAPVTGATPTATITATTEYTAVISWSPSGSTFGGGTVYTATITLTPKTGYTTYGIPANFFTVTGATATNPINSGVVTAIFPATQAYASTPSSIVLAVGGTAPVGGVTNVAIPSAGATDVTGVITGYVATSADKIKFTVTDSGSATSAITINGGGYTSGADYQIIPTTTLPTVIVTTTEAGKITGVRTFVITGPIVGADGLTYGIVMGADGKKWLDRNLGATRVATSFDDYQSYGNLYQWGRGADGHSLINHTSATAATAQNGSTLTLSATDTPGDNLFIKQPASPYDWRSTKNDNLWQGVNGTNNVCPAGFRLPTNTEQGALVTAAGITNSATAYSSSLKLTAAGYRDGSDASLYTLGTNGYYWSSSVSGTSALNFYFNASTVNPANVYARASGFTVRCLKD
jgi:uncharacterized protein (TIGR02145 family)